MGGSSKRSNGPVLSFRRSNSRSDALGSSSPSDTSSFYAFSTGPNFYSSPPSPNTSSFYASSTSANFCSSPPSDGFFNRSSSPTRVNLHGFVPLAPSPTVRLSIDRSRSPSRSMAVSPRDQVVKQQNGNPLTNLPKRTCMCSPTTHPGSFRCSLHKNSTNSQSVSYLPNRLHARSLAIPGDGAVGFRRRCQCTGWYVGDAFRVRRCDVMDLDLNSDLKTYTNGLENLGMPLLWNMCN
ncbi:hypothetical protein RHSIM_Rhsim07G0161300 [Rhododendron simsii]|uniref:Serine-rich protein-like protein n=1 Tax=Rhododendron simsii TaxID=118357 RepID=A0A834GRZ5_RHOSS|nr:hypothetical protein RHSIM_Rhsim07G0161300 [Rhododendron simsii]